MPLILPLVAVAAVAMFFLAKGSPGGVAPVWVPVRFASGQVEPGIKAKWHSTDDQIKQFGPRMPDYWSRNGYFVFGKDFYKPDWQVPIEAR